MKKHIILLVLIILTTSCQKYAHHDSEAPETPPAISTTQFLNSETVPQADPGTYFVQLSLKALPGNDGEYFLTREFGDESRVVARDLGINSSFTDKNTGAGQTYKYTLMKTTSSHNEEVESVDVTIPNDLVVKANQDLTHSEKNLSYGRLYLLSGSHLYTNGKNISINVKNLISENGVIETFPAGTQAPEGVEGRAGGKVFLNIERGTGTLTLSVHGEQGGVGSPGYYGQPGMHGSDGNPAAYGEKAGVPVNNVEEMFKFLPPVHPNWNYYLSCKTPSTDGGHGSDAIPAGPGGRGMRGGDSGIFEVNASDAKDLKIQLVNEAGKGGPGGPGGTGAPGGLGGQAGSDPHQLCPAAKPGGNGKDAPKGADGQPGDPGTLEQSSIN